MNRKIAIGLLHFVLLPALYAQSDLERTLRAGEMLVKGLTVLKTKTASENTKTIASVCIKNKLKEKITVVLTCKDPDGTEIQKELVVQQEGKECLFELPHGTYTYIVFLPDKEVYQKGEYAVTQQGLITIQ